MSRVTVKEIHAVLQEIVGHEPANKWGYDAAAVALNDQWRERARRALAGMVSLEADLEEIQELLDGYVDVEDGDYGQPAPNKAMSASSIIDFHLGRRPA